MSLKRAARAEAEFGHSLSASGHATEDSDGDRFMFAADDTGKSTSSLFDYSLKSKKRARTNEWKGSSDDRDVEMNTGTTTDSDVIDQKGDWVGTSNSNGKSKSPEKQEPVRFKPWMSSQIEAKESFLLKQWEEASAGSKSKSRRDADVAKPGEFGALRGHAAVAMHSGFGFIDKASAMDYGMGFTNRKDSSSAPKKQQTSKAETKSSLFNAFNTSIDQLCVGLEKIQFEREHEEAIHTRAEFRTIQRQSTISGGFRREQLIRESLDSMGLVRTKLQRQFHERAILANAWWIHGTDFETDRIEIMEKYSIDEILCEILAITPRRNGKTTMVAMLAAALVYHIPGFRQAIFSTGRRASQALMDLIVTFLLKLPDGRSRILRKNQEQLRLAPFPITDASGKRNAGSRYDENSSDTSLVMSLPNSETGMF